MRRTIALALVLTVGACSSPEDAPIETTTSQATTTTSTPESTTTTELPRFGISSPAFEDGDPIPIAYTCDGPDIRPELQVVGLPEGTKAVAIIVDDPDAPLGTWDHWVEFDIPAETGSYHIPSDTSPIGVAGVNSWKLEGYMGPCPPQGEEHTYHFTVFALEAPVGLPEGVNSEELRSAMEGRILESVELRGTYER